MLGERITEKTSTAKIQIISGEGDNLNEYTCDVPALMAPNLAEFMINDAHKMGMKITIDGEEYGGVLEKK